MLDMSVSENINISCRRHFLRGGLFLDHKKEAQTADAAQQGQQADKTDTSETPEQEVEQDQEAQKSPSGKRIAVLCQPPSGACRPESARAPVSFSFE